MPIENERKFVLKPPFNDLEKKISLIAQNSLLIEQAYLHRAKGFIVRIRSSTSQKYDTKFYEMCVKRSVNSECIEIETKINEEDYNRFWLVAEGKLKKIRYLVEEWEIDFFKDKHYDNYFAQAEIELPQGVAYPDVVHPIVKDNLLYQVMKGDDRFASKKLCDIYYTNKILHTLLEMKK